MQDKIIVCGARQHNLKNIDVEIPRDQLVVVTGLSGSGKSSLAFDTIFAEGQRRYVESLSSYARQFLGQMSKPDVDRIEGLSPAISIDQKTTSHNPRSTVGTVTEIHDYLRLLYARAGRPHCHKCGKPIARQTLDQMVDAVLENPLGSRLHLLAPVVRGRKGEYRKQLEDFAKQGYNRVRIDGEMRELGEEISLNKQQKHTIELVVDRLVLREDIRKRLADSLELCLSLAGDLALVLVQKPDGEQSEQLFSASYACVDCGISVEELTPRMFSFNNPFGACSGCGGLGFSQHIEPQLMINDATLSINQGALIPVDAKARNYFYRHIEQVAKRYGFSLDTPFDQLREADRHKIFFGCGDEKFAVSYFDEEFQEQRSWMHHWEGLVNNYARRYQESKSELMRQEFERYIATQECPVCHGARLKAESLAVKVGGCNIHELSCKNIAELLAFMDTMELTERERMVAERILREIRSRLEFLNGVGLDYLTLARGAATLSGGEAQRIRLATQIGSQLMGVLYILDEPSIGLHQRDNLRLIDSLKHLRDLGNSVLVVEHDDEIMRAADYIIDIGPGAGCAGGHVVSCGTPEQVMADEKSLTGAFLSGRERIEVPLFRRPGNGNKLQILGAAVNNLDNVDVDIPLGCFVCVTGVSGSGKSSLINEVLSKAAARRLNRAHVIPGAHKDIVGLEQLEKVIVIDQDPIGRTPRSNPATYTGLFDLIRELYAQVPEARARGYKAGRFSFNVRGGRCEACQGDGIVKIEMHFLPDIFVPCEVCRGARYNRETLDVLYKGKSIADVLAMTVDEALVFFANLPKLQRKLQTLSDVGLGYITLGQSATTLSGGEAQRVKLATELARRSNGRTLYILDEPTTGLHSADIRCLLSVLNRLVDNGDSVVVIEHNLDVIKSADYIIDMGPEGGNRGGHVVACGTPEEVAASGTYTGDFLRRELERFK
ncbi:MAG: excinuclease ABC subunit UvrA [Firmicutes bacterium]|nr:excinuclease ABC subunit UvrA [Bacillota bacterium]